MYFEKGFPYIVAILLTITSFSVEEDNKNEGPAVNHFCSKLESYTVEEEVTYNETYQETVKEWCLSIPPRCTRFKTLYRKVNKTIPVKKTKIVFECCDGYEKVQDKCVGLGKAKRDLSALRKDFQNFICIEMQIFFPHVYFQ
ncbi:hypothetical protein TNIN_100821 [Trichonephila inaurata madagascariensis]|uniref:EMI domain-containing protein n=1 Tax=Trichonephila inaurata madagascariensis TaxID=2747483 RepID=A0A8X6MGS4_9ARAC|nr:hypothetical protein TNIN_100821 [Trichonephila inaurata madagascariensis]